MTNDIVNVIVNDYDDDHELVLAYIQIQITQVRVYSRTWPPKWSMTMTMMISYHN